MFFRLVIGLVLQFAASLFIKPPPGPKAAAFSDFSIPQSNDGDRYLDFGGTVWQAGSVVAWAGDFRSRGIYKKQKKK
jgi:hypothetical protein